MKSPISEAYITYLWQTKQFQYQNLCTTEGTELDLIKFGTLNLQAGPDISDAKIRLGDILWHGHIEFHVKASDWDRHRHNESERYDNVILHVVWQEDRKIVNRQGQSIPCLELEPLVSASKLERYFKLQNLECFVPCENLIQSVDTSKIKLWLERVLLEKLEEKHKQISRLHEKSDKHLEQTLFVYTARYFGLPSNQEAMEQLATRTPIRILKKHADHQNQLEALLFGQAKLLEPRDEYANALKQEYQFLSQKYDLQAMPKNIWKLSRMRPNAFPTIRIALLSMLLNNRSDFFANVLTMESANELKERLSVQASEYWNTHYHFQKESKHRPKRLGKQFVDLLIINAIVPLQFFYAKLMNDQEAQQRALELLIDLKAESNKVISAWKKLGLTIENAFDSQALLYLKKSYCDQKHCTRCSIGHQLLRGS